METKETQPNKMLSSLCCVFRGFRYASVCVWTLTQHVHVLLYLRLKENDFSFPFALTQIIKLSHAINARQLLCFDKMPES